MTLGCPSIPTQPLTDPGSSASPLPSQIPASSALPGVGGFTPPLLLPPLHSHQNKVMEITLQKTTRGNYKYFRLKVRKVNAELSVPTDKSNMGCNSQICTKHQRQGSLIPSLLPSSTRGGFILNAHTEG